MISKRSHDYLLGKTLTMSYQKKHSTLYLFPLCFIIVLSSTSCRSSIHSGSILAEELLHTSSSVLPTLHHHVGSVAPSIHQLNLDNSYVDVDDTKPSKLELYRHSNEEDDGLRVIQHEISDGSYHSGQTQLANNNATDNGNFTLSPVIMIPTPQKFGFYGTDRCLVDEESLKSGEKLSESKDYYATKRGEYNHLRTKNDSVITLGLISPYIPNRLILGAMRLAVERVNADPNLLPGRTLRYITSDIGSSEVLPIKVMTEMRDRGTSAFIGGPEDTCVSEALVAAAWNLPMISYKCSDHRVSDKGTYHTFARTLPPSSKVSKSVVALLKAFNWNKIVLVVSHQKKDRMYKVVIDAFTTLGKKNGIDITDHYNLADYIPKDFPEMERIVAESFARTRVYVFIGEHIALISLIRALANKKAFDNGEYIIISIDDKLNVTGNFFDIEYFGENSNSRYGRPTENMMKAYRSVLKLIPSHPKTGYFSNEVKDSILKYSTQYPFCTPYHPFIFSNVQVPVEAAYLYDAVMIYAHAVHAILEDGLDLRNGTAVFERIKNRSYHSIQGYDVYMDDNGDADGNFTVVSLLPLQEEYGNSSRSVGNNYENNYSAYEYWDEQTNSTIGLNMQPVGYFTQVSSSQTASQSGSGLPPNSPTSSPSFNASVGCNLTSSVSGSGSSQGGCNSSSVTSPSRPFKLISSRKGNNHGFGVQDPTDKFETPADDIAQAFSYFSESRPILWVGGKPPKAEPKCGFKNEHCVYKPDWRTISVCSIVAAFLAVGFVMAGRHYRYEQKLACLLWKIDMQHVILISSGPPEPVNGTKGTVSICRQLVGTTMEAEPPLEVPCKKAYTRIGFYKGMIVAVKPIHKKSIDLTRNIRKELIQIRELRHDNIIPFIGASVDHGNIHILTAYSARGSLEDVLQNEDLHLDNMFLASLVADLIKGMIYLHESEIISHGNLKSSNCLVDSRWVLQISDFGLHEFKAGQESRERGSKEIRKLLWKAPELLRDPNPLARGTQKGDVYSFGIILYEMIGRTGPWGKTQLDASEIIEKVTNPELVDPSESETGYLRPSTFILDCGETILKCLEACWEEDPDLRPDFRFIRLRLKEMQAGLKPNIFDNMLSIMEKYACNLEDLVQERTIQLMEEKKKTDALLHRMLPKTVAESLKRGDPVEAESFDSVTIYFSDIVGFTALSAVSTPLQVVALLNDLYTCFDSIISNYDVYKVETIGDAYMVVSGLPIRNGNQHAGEIASMALHLLDRIQNFEIRHRPGERLKLRAGIHSGCVVAGVVGLKMPRYCLFGDTVNTASRMESSGEPLKIHVSDVTKNILEQIGGYFYEERGIIPIKGKGEMCTYWLNGEDPTRTRKNSTESNTLCNGDNIVYQNELHPKSGVIGFGQEGLEYNFDLNQHHVTTVTNNNFKGFTYQKGSECPSNNVNQGFTSSETNPHEMHTSPTKNGSYVVYNITGDNEVKSSASIEPSPQSIDGKLKAELTGNNHTLPNGKVGYKPTTWLLSECQNGKDHNGYLLKSIGGKYVSCSNVFQECKKVNIIKELKKNGSTAAAAAAAALAVSSGNNGRIGGSHHLHQQSFHSGQQHRSPGGGGGGSSATRFRSAPIVTFMDTSAPTPSSTPWFAFEEQNFV